MRKRAIKAMHHSDLEPDETYQDSRVVFMNLIFGEFESTISREDFCNEVMKDKCKWIFSDHMIRGRMRTYFMNEEVL